MDKDKMYDTILRSIEYFELETPESFSSKEKFLIWYNTLSDKQLKKATYKIRITRAKFVIRGQISKEDF